MGLIGLAPLLCKSFGITGVGLTTTNPAYNAEEQGYLSILTEMDDNTSTTKYLVVSVFPNDMNAVAPTGGAFSIMFSSSIWNTDLPKAWVGPT